MPKHPRLIELSDFIAGTRAALRARVSGLSEEQAAGRPAPEAWSTAEIIEHLRLAETSVAGLLERLLERAERENLRPETETTLLLAAGFPTPLPDRPVAAPPTALPNSEVSLAPALAGLEAARARLEAAIERGDGRALGELTHPHFALGTMTFYEWLIFVGHHEARHTRQIDRTLAGLVAVTAP